MNEDNEFQVLDKGNVVNFVAAARVGSTVDYIRIPAQVRDELRLKNKEKVVVTIMRYAQK
jgi:hypothetical protein